MPRPAFVLLTTILAVILVVPAAILWSLSSPVLVRFDPVPRAVAPAIPIRVALEGPHGARRVNVWIEQGSRQIPLNAVQRPPSYFLFWRTKPAPQTLVCAIPAESSLLADGKAKLIAEAQSNDFRGRRTRVEVEVEVALHPPSVSADTLVHFVFQGGAEAVNFTPSGYWTEAGVRIGKQTFASFPKPGSKTERVAIFAVPWETPTDAEPVVYVRNPAGAEAIASIRCKISPRRFRERDIAIDDRFLERVVNQIQPGGSGTLLARFLAINGDLRRVNNQALSELRTKTADHPLWSEKFRQMQKTKLESSFADVRSYVYQGTQVDRQVHLGLDLASVQHAPVPAANDGKVVFAGDLGIYGKCVVVDHGLGVQSVYGHMSEIAVKEGQPVKREETLGRSGATGLAGGDHLHFTMQVGGVQMNPIEWWDAHWMKEHINSRIGLQ